MLMMTVQGLRCRGLAVVAAIVVGLSLGFQSAHATDWVSMPGSATDVGDRWVIGTERIGSDYGIWRWTNGSWQQMPGHAVRIGGTYNQPMVANSQGQIFQWSGSDWKAMPGSATDVGDGWVIGTDRIGSDYGIWRWNNGSWQQMPGHAVRIGGNYRQPLVVNSQGQIFQWSGSDWKAMPGSATDVGDGWVIGTERIGGDYGIWRWSNGNWQQMPGHALHIGGTNKQPLVVNSQGQIFSWGR